MKLNLYDVHDRFEHFTSQSFDIDKTCQNMVDTTPFGEHPFYIFAHKREIDLDERKSLYEQFWREALISGTPNRFNSIADVPNARLIWIHRLTKPKAEANSMLFKAYPGSDNIKIIWIIPAQELWEEFSKGKMMGNESICESIHKFKTDKAKLEAKEADDLDDATIDAIYEDISLSMKRPKFLRI
jgi:hypothetical protein